jgi:hypothetical protein
MSLSNAFGIPRYGLGALLAAAIIITIPGIALGQCATPAEEGRWRNLDENGDPIYLDVKMLGCGDQVLNGDQSESTHYTMRAWNKVGTVGFHGRPIINANYRLLRGQKWLYAPLPNIPYMDHTWVVAAQHDGKPQLHVLINHAPLDKRPSFNTEYWFIRSK